MPEHVNDHGCAAEGGHGESRFNAGAFGVFLRRWTGRRTFRRGGYFSRRLDRRLEEMIYLVVAFEELGYARPAAHDGADRQNHQRREHDPGRFVHAVTVTVIVTAPSGSSTLPARLSIAKRRIRPPLPQEGHKPQAKHIERGQGGGDYAYRPQQMPSERTLKRLTENVVFAEEPGERRKAGDGEGRSRHRPERPGNELV